MFDADPERMTMSIVHIERPIDLERSSFEVFTPPPVGNHPQPTPGSVGAYAAPDGTVETGTRANALAHRGSSGSMYRTMSRPRAL
jgi:hypothetical protein